MTEVNIKVKNIYTEVWQDQNNTLTSTLGNDKEKWKIQNNTIYFEF
jgi:hypothetical protein